MILPVILSFFYVFLLFKILTGMLETVQKVHDESRQGEAIAPVAGDARTYSKSSISKVMVAR